MKTTSLIITLLFFTSCATYQVHHLSIENEMKDASENLSTYQDSIQFEYVFTDESLFFDLNVINESKTPVEIDWERSYLVYNSKIYPVLDFSQKVSFWGESYRWGRSYWRSRDYVAQGMIEQASRTTFLPPHSTLEMKLGEKNMIQFYELESNFSEKLGTKTENFNLDKSPFKFRIFITYKLEGDETRRYIDQTIFTSFIKEYKSKPVLLADNNLYFKKKDRNMGFGVFSLSVVLVAIISFISFGT